jgi:hypothetical protein
VENRFGKDLRLFCIIHNRRYNGRYYALRFVRSRVVASSCELQCSGKHEGELRVSPTLNPVTSRAVERNFLLLDSQRIPLVDETERVRAPWFVGARAQAPSRRSLKQRGRGGGTALCGACFLPISRIRDSFRIESSKLPRRSLALNPQHTSMQLCICTRQGAPREAPRPWPARRRRPPP